MKLFNAGLAAALACVTSLALAAQSNDWPEFRGPDGQGHSAAKNAPTEWSATKNVKWRTVIAGRGWSSPVLAANRLYLTTAVSESATAPVSLRALCVDADSGKILWDVEVFRHPPATLTQSLHQKNSLASPTPIARDGLAKLFF